MSLRKKYCGEQKKACGNIDEKIPGIVFPCSFYAMAVVFSMYATCTTILSSAFNWLYRANATHKQPLILFGIFTMTIMVFVLFFFLTLLVSKKIVNIPWDVVPKARSINKKELAMISLICFIPCFINLLKCFPGGLSNDNINQWQQVQSFTFDNWHPVLHTLCIWFLSRICNNWAFIVICQMLLFAFSLGLLYSTLSSFGIPKIILNLSFTLIALNPATNDILCFAWKDVAFSICLLFLMTPLVKIVLTNGEWLQKARNVIAISICMGLITFVRHNGFFLTCPLAVLLCIFYCKQKHVKWLLPIMIITYLFVRVPLYNALNVTYPDNTVAESIGVPMTIMINVYNINPNAISPQAKEALLMIAPQEVYDESKSTFIPYNSIKFRKEAERNYFDSIAVVLQMTWETIKNDPKNSLASVIQLTDFVWDATGKHPVDNRLYITDNTLGITPDPQVQVFGKALSMFTDIAWTPFGVLFETIGIYILCLLFIAVVTFPYLRWKSFLYIAPIMIYNVGTTLLLCGPDYRFFHFNMVLAPPLIILLLAKCVQEKKKLI